MRVDDELAGRRIRCPACFQPLRIPAEEPPEFLDAWEDVPDEADEERGDDDEPAPVIQKNRKAVARFRHPDATATAWLTLKKILGGISLLIGGLLAALMVYVVITGRGEFGLLRGLFVPIAMIGMGIAWIKGGTFGS